MSRLALYRKYRPMTFDDLVGQDHIRDILKNAVKQNKISHAYLFSGPRGTGKTSAARILARAINCENLQEGSPCNECRICKAAIEESLTDLIEMDAASHTGVDNVRDLIDKAQFSPTTAERKVYIIDEVHMLSKPAFNALLKTLEEPPTNTHFILATTEAHKIIDTIISRCQRFDFHRIGSEPIVGVLNKVAKEEGIKADQEALKIVAHNAKGSLRDALSIFEQITYKNKVTMDGVKQSLGMASSNVVKQFIDAIRGNRVTEALTYVSDLLTEGIDLGQFTNEILLFLRVEMLEAVEQDNKQDAKSLVDLIDIFLEANLGLRDAVISQLPLEMAVVKACREAILESEKSVETQDIAPETPEVLSKTSSLTEESLSKDETPKTPTPSAPPKNSPKTIESLLGNIQKASVRTILKSATLTQDKKDIGICVGSDFAKKQLETAENNQILTTGIRSLFGEKIGIKISVKKKKGVDEDEVNEIFG